MLIMTQKYILRGKQKTFFLEKNGVPYNLFGL